MIILSIVIPVYNSERFISETLTMLLSQDLNNSEIIIVNDGSIDRTEAICLEYVKRYDFIHLINISKAGVSVARNTGIDNAKGEYIYFFDSDDKLKQDSIINILRIIQEENTDIIAFGYLTEYSNKVKKIYKYDSYSNKKFLSDNFLKMILRKNINCNICSIIFRRKLLVKNQIRFPIGIKIGEDLEFIFSAIHTANEVYYISDIFFIYKLRDDSVTKGYHNLQIDQCNALLLLLNLFRKIYSDNDSREFYFYLSNMYILLLFYYLKSSEKNKAINDFFINNKYILKKRIVGKYNRLIVIKIMSILPITMLLTLFRKR
jgi:glycosyltransferase involved in cell wall biosynthesis